MMPDSTEEERCAFFGRVRIGTRAVVRLADPQSPAISVLLRDVCSAGVRLMMDKPLEPGEQLWIYIPRADNSEVLVPLCGTVVACDEAGFEQSAYQVSATFVEGEAAPLPGDSDNAAGSSEIQLPVVTIRPGSPLFQSPPAESACSPDSASAASQAPAASDPVAQAAVPVSTPEAVPAAAPVVHAAAPVSIPEAAPAAAPSVLATATISIPDAAPAAASPASTPGNDRSVPVPRQITAVAIPTCTPPAPETAQLAPIHSLSSEQLLGIIQKVKRQVNYLNLIAKDLSDSAVSDQHPIIQALRSAEQAVLKLQAHLMSVRAANGNARRSAQRARRRHQRATHRTDRHVFSGGNAMMSAK